MSKEDVKIVGVHFPKEFRRSFVLCVWGSCLFDSRPFTAFRERVEKERRPFLFPESRLRKGRSWPRRRFIFPDPLSSPLPAPDHCHPHISFAFQIQKLRHNTQKVPATLPSVSHARSDSFVAALSVSNSGGRGAGTDTEEEGGAGREGEGAGLWKWRSNLALAGAVFRTEDSSSTITINIFL